MGGMIIIALFSSEGCASTRTLTRNCKYEEKDDKTSKLRNLEKVLLYEDKGADDLTLDE